MDQRLGDICFGQPLGDICVGQPLILQVFHEKGNELKQFQEAASSLNRRAIWPNRSQAFATASYPPMRSTAAPQVLISSLAGPTDFYVRFELCPQPSFQD